jgi:hypothetical protein
MFLSDTQFQKTSGVTRRCYAVFARVNSILSDNQPCLLQNTLSIRQLRLYAGFFLYSELCTIILRQLRSIVVVTPSVTAITPVCRGKSPFFQLFSRLSSLSLHDGRIFAAQPAPHRRNQPCLLHCLVFYSELGTQHSELFLSSLSTFYFALSTSLVRNQHP